MSLFEFFVDLSLVGFNFYKDCNLELILIVFGSFLSKSSSSFNYVNNMSYVMLELYTDKASDIAKLNTLTIDYQKRITANEILSTSNERREIGRYLGKIVTDITDF